MVIENTAAAPSFPTSIRCLSLPQNHHPISLLSPSLSPSPSSLPLSLHPFHSLHPSLPPPHPLPPITVESRPRAHFGLILLKPRIDLTLSRRIRSGSTPTPSSARWRRLWSSLLSSCGEKRCSVPSSRTRAPSK